MEGFVGIKVILIVTRAASLAGTGTDRCQDFINIHESFQRYQDYQRTIKALPGFFIIPCRTAKKTSSLVVSSSKAS